MFDRIETQKERKKQNNKKFVHSNLNKENF